MSFITSFLDVPRFMENNTVHEKCIGENASILCSVVGNPVPNVLLYHKGILLARNVSSLSHRLTIDSASKFGAYNCISNNSVGIVSIATTLKEKCESTVFESVILCYVLLQRIEYFSYT